MADRLDTFIEAFERFFYMNPCGTTLDAITFAKEELSAHDAEVEVNEREALNAIHDGYGSGS